MANERRMGDVQRQYEGDGIVVNWEPAFCIHCGNCSRGLPEVFNVQARPWVDAGAASADAIAAVIDTCPSGALSYERTDGVTPEPVAVGVEVGPQPNGPLYLRGDIEVRDADGNLIRRTTRAALCRCGWSDNKPFCDTTHARIGFVS
jgi:uncharacterized Fe-S cluster protein YjdI